jgi:hypothetical protein
MEEGNVSRLRPIQERSNCPIFDTEVAMATRYYYKTTESIENSIGDSVYIFRMNSEAATRKVDWTSDPNVAIIL